MSEALDTIELIKQRLNMQAGVYVILQEIYKELSAQKLATHELMNLLELAESKAISKIIETTKTPQCQS